MASVNSPRGLILAKKIGSGLNIESTNALNRIESNERDLLKQMHKEKKSRDIRCQLLCGAKVSG